MSEIHMITDTQLCVAIEWVPYHPPPDADFDYPQSSDVVVYIDQLKKRLHRAEAERLVSEQAPVVEEAAPVVEEVAPVVCGAEAAGGDPERIADFIAGGGTAVLLHDASWRPSAEETYKGFEKLMVSCGLHYAKVQDCDTAGVTVLPTFVFYDEGIEIGRHEGDGQEELGIFIAAQQSALCK